MTVTVTLEFKTSEEAIQALAKVAGISPATPPVVQIQDKAQPPVARQKRKYTRRATQVTTGSQVIEGESRRIEDAQTTPPADAKATQDTQPPVAVQAQEAAPIVAATVTEEQLQAKVEQLFNAKGLQTARDTMTRFGVKRAKELLPVQRAKFVAYADRVIAGEIDPAAKQ